MWITSRYEFDRRRKAIGGPVVVTTLVIFLAIMAASVALIVSYQHRSPLPKAVSSKVSFVVFFPDKTWKVEPSEINYEASAKVLTMTATKSSGPLTLTEQAAPSQFTDIPQYYPALLDKLNEYQSFGTVNGTVYLTHPTELNGGTEAVLNSNGTFMLVYPKATMTESSWRQFFNNLRVLK